MTDFFFRDAFGVLSCPFWSTILHAVWCSAANTHLYLLDRVVSGARFLTGGVFECDVVHCRSLTVLRMLYNISCNLMHSLSGALPVPYVPV